MMKASPKKTMAAYVADGEVERRAPPPRPTTATGGSRGGLGAFAHRPGSAPSSAGASPIKGAHAARRVHPSALASPVRATAAGAAASKKANDQRRREEGRRSINERTASTRAGVKAKVVTRHAPPTQAQSHAVTTLWDKISGACDDVTQALEECAKAMVEPDPNRGTPGFGNSSSNSTSAPGVSGTTRRKNASRASLKLREAKSQFNSFTGGFDELRRHSAALAAALHRSETSAGTVTEQLASTAGYAEETTNRLRTTAREKEVAEMTAKQAKSALQDALARIEVLEKERRDIRGYEARLEEADYARANFAIALERAEKAETSAARHKEGVAKLTADNMVFLMRLKETESEIATLRKETADARIELEGKRGAWFDRARKDVERVVQRSIKRAEESDAALELEFEKQERTAEEFAMELAKINDVRAENELLAMAAAKAQKAAESALMEKVKIYEELQRWKTKEFDASSSAKASTTAAAEAYESAGVLRKELNETKAELAGARSFVDAARAEVDAKTTALANQQAVNAGVMKMKNAMEWRVLEMQTALEQRGIAPPPPSAPPPNSSTSSIGPSSISEWTAGATTVSKTVGGTLPPTPATVPPHQTTGGASSNAGNEIRTIPGFELSPLPASDLKPTPAPISLVTPQNASYGSAEHSHSAAKEFVMDALNESPHSTAAFFGLSSPGKKEIPKISPPDSQSNAANFAHFRAMFPDLQGEELDGIEGLDTLDVSGAPSLRSDAKLAGDSTPPVKRRNKRRAAADANDASTAAPLIARGTTKQSYGATSPAAGELKTLGSGTSPKKPPAGPGPEVRQTKKSAAAAAANRAVYASVDSVKASLVNDDDVLRARAIHAARERSTPPIGSPARVPPPSTDQKAKEEFDAFLREVEDDSVHGHPYQPLRSSESDVTSEGGTSLESAPIRPPPNPWLNDPRDAEGAAGGSPGREFPPLGAMTLGGGGGSPSRRSPSRKSPAKRPPAVGELATAPSMAAKGGASFKASMAAAAAAAAGSVVDSANVRKDSPDADDDLLDAFSDDVDNGAILRMFQAGALDNDDAKRETAAARAMESAANANVSGFRAEFFGETTDDDDGHELVSEDVFERAAARALAKRGEGGGQEGTRINPNPNPTPFDGPGWIGADGPGPARSNSFASARTSLLAVDGSSDEDQERARVASDVPTRAVAFDDSESDPDSTDADSIYDVFKNPGASGYVPTAGTQRRPELSRFASSSNGQGLDEEHAAAMDRLMASGGRRNDGGRLNAGGAGDDLPRGDSAGDGGFTFSNALPGSGRVPVPDNTGTSADRPATARGRSRGGGVSFSNALPSIR